MCFPFHRTLTPSAADTATSLLHVQPNPLPIFNGQICKSYSCGSIMANQHHHRDHLLHCRIPLHVNWLDLIKCRSCVEEGASWTLTSQIIRASCHYGFSHASQWRDVLRRRRPDEDLSSRSLLLNDSYYAKFNNRIVVRGGRPGKRRNSVFFYVTLSQRASVLLTKLAVTINGKQSW